MAKFRVLEKSFINNRIVEPGDVVEYDGKHGKNLEPIKKGRGEAAEAAPAAEGETPALA
jgi:hypothetical protein